MNNNEITVKKQFSINNQNIKSKSNKINYLDKKKISGTTNSNKTNRVDTESSNNTNLKER